jgi:carbon-monoxide dehydrogenase medium subunit
LHTFEYHAPQTIDEAVRLLAGDATRPLAGGTDLVVQMKEGATRFTYPETIISLDRVSELRFIEQNGDGLRIGAGATMTDIASHQVIQERFPALAEGAGVVGSLQTMNMATIGGNACNAAPSADTAPALLVYDAEAVIVGAGERRTLPMAQFWRGPGLTAMEPGELLTELRLPAQTASTGGSTYERNTPRKQMDIAVVGVAVSLALAGETIEQARVALGAVAPTPIRATTAEAALTGQPANDETFTRAAEAASTQDASPIDDVRASAAYRRHLVKVMTVRLLVEATRRAKGEG